MPNLVRVCTVRRSDAVVGVSLRRRRRWFADDNTGQGSDSQDENGRDAQDDDPGRDAQDPNASDELAKLRQQNADLQKRLKEVNSESAKRRREKEKALEGAGEWERLAKEREAELTRLEDELEQVRPRLDTLTESIKERNTGRIEQIPEKNRSLVPTGYDPEDLAGWLDANWGKLTARPAPDIDAGAGGDGGKAKKVKLTPDEKVAADAFDMTEQEYAKLLDDLES